MSNRMWGGRFASAPSEIMEEINASVDFDKRLAPQDIRGSMAHAAMLARPLSEAVSAIDRVRTASHRSPFLHPAGR